MKKLFVLTLLLIARPVSADPEDFATRMAGATYKLFNKDSTATGFFIVDPTPGATPQSSILVTAGHVLERMTGDDAIVVLRDPQPDGSYQRRDWKLPIRAGKQPLWTKHPDLDIAVVRVTLPADSHVAPLSFDSLIAGKDVAASGLRLAGQIYVFGYPSRVESNESAFPITRNAIVSSYPLTPVSAHKTFVADFSSFAGDSGGPVFLAGKGDKPLVAGLVLSQIRHDDKVETLYEERTVHFPLALSNVVQAEFIRETITGLPKK